MKRLLLPFVSLTGILWLTAGWLTWVIHNEVGMVNGIVLGGLVTLAAIYLLRTCVSLMSARTFVSLLTLSLVLFSILMVLRYEADVWQSIVLAAAFILALVGLTIGVDKLTGSGWEFTLQQIRGLLTGCVLLVAAAYLLPSLVWLMSNSWNQPDWLSNASLLLASFRFR
jgi:hypothetical protein